MSVTTVRVSLLALSLSFDIPTVKVNTPNGQAPPLITGTFGSADFMHSMLGEATE
jgi:hypothetical protein